VLATLVSLYGALVVISVARGGSNGNDVAKKAADLFTEVKIPGIAQPAPK